VNTAYDFSIINDYAYVEKRYTVTGLRTWYELRRLSCLQMEYIQPDKKGICTGRSFGQKTDDYNQIEDSLASFVLNIAPKLREQGSLCDEYRYSYKQANLTS
jgi:DNA polymerase V